MTETFSLRYRPRKFSDVVGQPVVSTVLQKMIINKKVFPCFLFSGSRGTGKTSTARIFASTLLCQNNSSGESCEQCEGCLNGDSDFSIVELDAASNGSVADMRDLRDLVRYQTSSGIRVVIIDEAHCMSREAFNALLKTLEEPPPGTYFVLVTTSPNKIPETILTRSIHLLFKKISLEDIQSRLEFICEKESISLEEGILKSIALRSKGSLRDSINALETVNISETFTYKDYSNLFVSKDYSIDIILSSIDNDYYSIHKLFTEWSSEVSEPSEVISSLTETFLGVIICHQKFDFNSKYSELLPVVSAKQSSFILGKLWTIFLRGRTPTEIDAIIALVTGLLVEVLGTKIVETPEKEKISYSEIKSLV